MKEHHDPWYVRLPDGKIIKAKSTSSVRHHVEAGNIPLNSMARRDTEEEWVSLVWISEFADFGEGDFEVAMDVVAERLQGRDVNDLRFVGKLVLDRLPQQRIDRRQKRG